MLKVYFVTLTLLFATILSNNALAKNSSNNQISDDEFETYETEKEIEIYDPLEKYNRKIFAFNNNVDKYFLEHVAKFYRKATPKPIRKSVRNFLTNLSAPLSGVNSLLQGNIDNGLATFSSFLINSTVGVAGIFDVAGNKNIKYSREDFGQTLGNYGLNSGAYLMLPILGPSSVRDFGGLAFDKAIDPNSFNVLDIGNKAEFIESDYRIFLAVASAIDTRENFIDIIDDIRENSFDPYATIRSAYIQRRNTEIKN